MSRMRVRARAVTLLGLVELAGCGFGGSGPTKAFVREGRFTAVASRGNHTCALTSAGVPECWGTDAGPSERLHAPSSSSPWTQLSVGASFGCGLRADRSVSCFGACVAGSCDAPSGAFVEVEAGQEGVACALDALGTLTCWGDHAGKLEGAPEDALRTIEIAPAFACAITKAANVRCWGERSRLRPTASSEEVDLATAIYDAAPEGKFVDVAVGSFYACAIAESGSVKCWGDDNHGQLRSPSGSFVSIDADGSVSCALDDKAMAWCWGGTAGWRPNGKTGRGPFESISVGSGHACAVAAGGAVTCWGKAHAGPVTGKGRGILPEVGKGLPPIEAREGSVVAEPAKSPPS